MHDTPLTKWRPGGQGELWRKQEAEIGAPEASLTHSDHSFLWPEILTGRYLQNISVKVLATTNSACVKKQLTHLHKRYRSGLQATNLFHASSD